MIGRALGDVGILATCCILSIALWNCRESDERGDTDCESLSSQASLGRREAQDQAERSCSQDGDCELVDYELNCFADCGYPSAVAHSSLSSLEAEVESVDSRFCRTFEAQGCAAPIVPPCGAVAGTRSAVCRENQCVIKVVPF
jgi:hypothetical protein